MTDFDLGFDEGDSTNVKRLPHTRVGLVPKNVTKNTVLANSG